MSKKKDVRQLLEELERQGCLYWMAHNGHWRVSHPDSTNIVTVPATPSDRRSLLLSRTKLRRFLPVSV